MARWWSSQLIPSPISARSARRAPVRPSTGFGVAICQIRTTPERDADRLGDEGDGRPGREQQRAQSRPGQLVEPDEAELQAGVADAEVVPVHEHRQQGAGGRVGEDLRRAEQEHRDEHHGDVHRTGDDGDAQQREHHRAQTVAQRDHESAVDAVGDGAGVEAENQPGEPLEQHRRGDPDGVVGLAGHQQRPGGQGQPVAGVAHPRGGQQPAEARAEACGSDGTPRTTPEPCHNQCEVTDRRPDVAGVTTDSLATRR